jgi:O-antigen/teichoic acid export membrane protein
MSAPAPEEPAQRAASEKRDVALGAGLVSAAALVSGVWNVLTVTALTRLLERPTFAALSLAYLLSDTLAAVVPLGLPAALAFFVPKRGDDAARALGFWTGMTLLGLTLPVSLGLVLLGPRLAETPVMSMALGYLGLYVLGEIPSQAMWATLLARRSYRAFFGVQIVSSSSRSLSLIVPTALGAALPTILTCYVLVAALRFTMFLSYFLVFSRGSLSRSAFCLREHLGYGLPLSLSMIVGKANQQIDKYVVAGLCSAEVFAAYAVGAFELPLVPVLAYAVTTALVPSLVLAFDRRDDASFLGYWHGSIVKVASIMMPVFFYFAILSGPTIRTLFSASYADAVVPFRIYLLLLPLRLCGYGAILRAIGDTRWVLWSAILMLVVNIGLIPPLFATAGIAGPAVAAVVAQLTGILVILSRIRRRLGVTWGGVFPTRAVLRAAAVAAVAAIPLVGVALALRGDAVRLLAGIPVYLAGYLALGLAAGTLSRADLRYLIDLVSFRQGRAR